MKNTALTLNVGALADKKQLAAFQANIVAQLQLIDSTENDNVKRRLFVGLALRCIKKAVAPGEWMPWLRQHVKTSQRNVNYMMRIAGKFVEKMRIDTETITALPSGDFSLEVKDGALRELLNTADKFIDEMSWGELLAANKVRESGKLGGARGGGDTDPAPVDPKAVAELKRAEASDVIARTRQLFVQENIFQFLKPDEIRATVSALEALVTEVRAAVKPLLKKS